MASRPSQILIVESEPDLLQLLSVRLKSAGYSVRGVSTGEEGLKELEDGAPDLILLDFMMPKLNGFEVCRRIRSEHRFDWVPIVALTTLAEVEVAKRAIRSGADGYLVKPFDLPRLLDTIESVLEFYSDRPPRRGPQVVRGTSPHLLRGEYAVEKIATLELEAQLMNRVGLRISHELRTTLTALREAIAILQENSPPLSLTQQGQLIQIAARNLERLTRFITELVAYSESQKVSPSVPFPGLAGLGR